MTIFTEAEHVTSDTYVQKLLCYYFCQSGYYTAC